RILREQLGCWSLRHDSCASAGEALDRLRAAREKDDPYRIAIIDYQMPGMDCIALGRAIRKDPAPCDTALATLTSVSHRFYGDELSVAGYAGYLLKPVHQSDLMNMLATAWHGRDRREPELLLTLHAVRDALAAPDAEPPATPARVLVVEDNAINQKVAMRMLINLGCRVDLAGTGKEAVAMLEVISYDLVFMDVQMPEM